MTTYSIYSSVVSATTDASGTAPVLVSAVVENAAPTKVVLTYDQALDETSVPETTDFTLAGKTISLIEVSGTDVTVTVSAAYAYGDSIAISYTAGTNPIRGSVGEISADDLTDESVTNNVSMDTDLATYIDGLVTPLSAAQLVKINTFLIDLKAGLGISVLSEVFDVLYYLGNETAESSLRNMAKRLHDATAVNTPTFTAYEGWAGDGISSYIDTNYNPNTAGTDYTLNNCSIGIYSRTDANALYCDIGVRTDTTNYTNIFSKSGGAGNTSMRLHNNVNNSINEVPADSLGMFICTRNGNTANDLYGYKNKTTLTKDAIGDNTTSIPNGNLFIDARNLIGTGAEVYSTRQLSLAFAGEYITTGMRDTIYDTFQALMTANGKQV